MFLAFLEKLPVAPCLFLHNATCEAAMNYTKRKNVFRLHLKDGSEYLFEANNHEEMNSWIALVCHQAGRWRHSTYICMFLIQFTANKFHTMIFLQHNTQCRCTCIIISFYQIMFIFKFETCHLSTKISAILNIFNTC